MHHISELCLWVKSYGAFCECVWEGDNPFETASWRGEIDVSEHAWHFKINNMSCFTDKKTERLHWKIPKIVSGPEARATPIPLSHRASSENNGLERIPPHIFTAVQLGPLWQIQNHKYRTINCTSREEYKNKYYYFLISHDMYFSPMWQSFLNCVGNTFDLTFHIIDLKTSILTPRNRLKNSKTLKILGCERCVTLHFTETNGNYERGIKWNKWMNK